VISAREWCVCALVIVSITLPFAGANAQTDSATKLEPVVIVTRSERRSVLRSPFAITIAQPDSARPGQRHTAIDETLALVPGLTAVSRNNPAQDARLSIRGFGSRSAFGVRGIRVLRDGMPLTLPDGQTPLDYMSLESVGRVEVLRGAASALYGNGSGGVIDLQTISPSLARASVNATQLVGADGFSRSAMSVSGTSGPVGYVGDAAYTRSDGYRAHSRQRATTGFARIGLNRRATDFAVTFMGLDNPMAENPGALTIDEMKSDARMADASSLRRNARKAVRQAQIGASAVHQFSRGDVSLAAFGGARSLDNPLTFGIIEVGRHSYGASAASHYHADLLGMHHTMLAGIDLQSQNDLRRNYATCADTVPVSMPNATCPFVDSERGIVTLDQRELVSSGGIYLSDEVDLSGRVSVTGGIRADRVRFEVQDHLIAASDPDDSGMRALGAVSPILGVVARLAATHSAYANVSSAFETPTATELGNHEDGSAGINQNLNPQRSTTLETGLKGWVGSHGSYDVALFTTRVKDELVPFEIPGSDGRRFFRNAGSTRRSGAELGAHASAGIASLDVAYSYSHFRFTDYVLAGEDFGGNEIPGIPSHRLQLALRVEHGGRFAVIETEAAGATYADDGNTVKASGYATSNFRTGMAFPAKSSRFSVTMGIHNVFDRSFASSIAVNAARGKFYEPAGRRSFFIGISARASTRAW
jgi:iron complex outermembrane receptor protein